MSTSSGRWKIAWNAPGEQRRPPPRGELGQPEKQETPPTDLLAEEDDGEDEGGYGEVENGTAEARTRGRKPDDPEGSRHAKAETNDGNCSQDGSEQPSSSPRMKTHRPPNRTSLTSRNDERGGQCDRDHRHDDADQRGDAGAWQRQGDGERDRVRDAEVDDDLAQGGQFSAVPVPRPLVAPTSGLLGSYGCVPIQTKRIASSKRPLSNRPPPQRANHPHCHPPPSPLTSQMTQGAPSGRGGLAGATLHAHFTRRPRRRVDVRTCRSFRLPRPGSRD